MAVTDYNNEGQTRRFFKINAKECKLYENVKNGEERENVARKNVEGKFVKLETVQKEYEGKPVEYLKLTLQDGEETYEVGTSWSSLGQQLVNSLAGEVKKNKLGNISVSVWSKTVDGKEYPRLTIHNNAESTEWCYGIEEQKKMIEVITNSKGEYKGKDSDQYIEALKSHIEAINANKQEDGMFGEDDDKGPQDDLPF